MRRSIRILRCIFSLLLLKGLNICCDTLYENIKSVTRSKVWTPSTPRRPPSPPSSSSPSQDRNKSPCIVVVVSHPPCPLSLSLLRRSSATCLGFKNNNTNPVPSNRYVDPVDYQPLVSFFLGYADSHPPIQAHPPCHSESNPDESRPRTVRARTGEETV